MKTPIQQRATAHGRVPPRCIGKQVVHEQIPFRNLADCLLAAYDGVSHRAFERFVARGSKAGNEIADWRTAESDLFLPVTVDLQDTEEALYALATVAGVSASQIAVAVEDRWLLISGHLGPQNEYERDFASCSAEAAERDARPQAIRWIDWDDLCSVLKDSETGDDFLCAESASEQPELLSPVKSRPFCMIELPAEVDVSRSVAVLSDGLIAIRMPKVRQHADAG